MEKTIFDEITEDTAVAFGFNYNGGEPNEVIVEKPSFLYSHRATFNFMYGHHSLGETVYPEQVIAIGDPTATNKIKGWRGTYRVINQELYDKLCK